MEAEGSNNTDLLSVKQYQIKKTKEAYKPSNLLSDPQFAVLRKLCKIVSLEKWLFI